jgi:hypothetical protein
VLFRATLAYRKCGPITIGKLGLPVADIEPENFDTFSTLLSI